MMLLAAAGAFSIVRLAFPNVAKLLGPAGAPRMRFGDLLGAEASGPYLALSPRLPGGVTESGSGEGFGLPCRWQQRRSEEPELEGGT